MPTEKCPRLPADEYVHMKRKSDGHRQGWQRSLTTCALASFSELPGSLQMTRHVHEKRDKRTRHSTRPHVQKSHGSYHHILLRKEGSCAIQTRYCFGRSHTLHHHESMQCRQIFFFLQTRKLKLRTMRNITRMVQSVNALRRQTRSFWLQSPSLWRPMSNLLS